MSHCAKFHGFFLYMLIALAVQVGAQQLGSIASDKFEETAGAGLSIVTKQMAVDVFIDGVDRGQTPFADSALRAGQYHVRLHKDGYRDREFNVTLTGTSRFWIEIEMETAAGQVRVHIQRAPGSPPNLPLEIIIDGADGGSSTELLTLPAGDRTIRARAFGWQENSQTVNVVEDAVTEVTIVMQPAVFRFGDGTAGRQRFNPNNPGALGRVEFFFEVSAPGTAVLRVQDSNGVDVYTAPLEPFATWAQTAVWNGRDADGEPLPQGRYTIIIQGESIADNGKPVQADLTLQTQIDYSLAIYPLTFASGISGLLFAPAPAALPVKSFQVDAAVFMGNFAADNSATSFKVPFYAGLRVSPLNKLELAAAFNVTPGAASNKSFGFSAGAKYAFFHGETIPLDIAACIGWNFAGASAAAALTGGKGGSLYLPLALNLGDTSAISCTALLSPGMRWPGTDELPRLLLPVGFFVKGEWFLAGLSFRQEFDFTDTALPLKQRMYMAGGAELKIYPPPSNIVYTVSGGVWHSNGKTGGFGGLGIGFLY